MGITVATSIKNKNFKQHNNISDEQFKVINSADKLNQVAGRFILTKYNDLRKIAEPKQLKLSFNQQTYFLQLAPFKDDYGLDWLIVVVVPESDFMEQINANTRTNIGLCIAALAIAIIVGILTSRWITQPILRLNTAAKALAEGKWQQKVKTNVLMN